MNISKIFRYSFLAVFNALIVYAIPLTLTFESWFLLSLIIVIGVLVNVVYFSERFLPMKWILPGMIFMISFVVFPAIYNSYVSFTNWSTGHILSKTQAINVLEDRVYTLDEQKGIEFDMFILQDSNLDFYYVANLDPDNILFGKAVPEDEIFTTSYAKHEPSLFVNDEFVTPDVKASCDSFWFELPGKWRKVDCDNIVSVLDIPKVLGRTVLGHFCFAK